MSDSRRPRRCVSRGRSVRVRPEHQGPGSGLESPDGHRLARHQNRASRGRGLGGVHPGRAAARDAESRHAARGPGLRPDAGGPALPARPLRRPGGRPGRLAADGRGPGRERALAVARRAPGAAGDDARRDLGVRRQRSRPARPAAGEPALAARGGGDRGVDGRAPRRPARRGRGRGRRGGGALSRPRSRGRGRREAAVRTQPDAGRGPARGGAARLRDERRPASAPARVPAAARRPGLVRDDERQVAGPDHGARHARSTAISRRTATASARRPTSRASRSPAWSRAR